MMGLRFPGAALASVLRRADSIALGGFCGTAVGVPAAAQLPVRLDFVTAALCAIVCVGLIAIVVLVIALVRTGRQAAPPVMPEKPSRPEVKTCPECGRLITRPQERFCIQCGARLLD